MSRVFVGFGFGAIQAGLFLYEAFRARRFSRLVVAEVVPEMVAAVRAGGGRYGLNVATATGIERHRVEGIEILNPLDAADRPRRAAAGAEASEIATALPSVRFYRSDRGPSVTELIAEAAAAKLRTPALPRAVVYTAENHNHAAEILDGLVAEALGPDAARRADRLQCLNTVIGKMSGVVTDPAQIREQRLEPVTPGLNRCFLVEAFNRILITRIAWGGFERGISVFEEKADLLPFEEAKLYGHNAVHALIGYLGHAGGCTFMAEAGARPAVLDLARDAFLLESGQALCRKHRGVDPLFTPEGYRRYAEDLLDRMLNPHLRDTVERITRDPKRKLGWDDRLIGTMRVALREGIEPRRFAVAAAAALDMVRAAEPGAPADLLNAIWTESRPAAGEAARVCEMILAAEPELRRVCAP